MSLLGIDIGSGSVKAVVFTTTGDTLGQAQVIYGTTRPGTHRAEADPNDLWNAVVASVRGVTASVDSNAVEALGVSAHGESFVAVDGHGQALGPMVMNADNRATAECDEIGKILGDERYHAITGLPLHPMYAVSKMRWMARHQADLFGRAAFLLGPADYVLLRMGLPACTEASLAARAGALDLERRQWSVDVLAAAGIPPRLLPRLVPAGQSVGGLGTEAAGILGLRSGIAVALAGHDQPCGALGAGCVRTGDVCDSAGTYECLTAVSAQRPESRMALPLHLNTGPHVVEGLFATLAFFPAGLAVNWVIETLHPDSNRNEFLDGLERRLAAIPGPTGVCVLPHWVGSCTPDWDPRATGAIIGLTPTVDRDRLVKAAFEGIACELAVNLEALTKVLGPCKRIRIHGGNGKYPWTVQLRADMTRTRFEVLAQRDAVSLGAAMLAATAAGMFPDPIQAAKTMSSTGTLIEPEPVTISAYGRQQQVYRAFNSALRPVYALAVANT